MIDLLVNSSKNQLADWSSHWPSHGLDHLRTGIDSDNVLY